MPGAPGMLGGSGASITHRGRIFGLGVGPESCGIWDLRGEGPPIETFEKTQAGWERAWQRFQELEARDTVPSWRRAKVGWVILHIGLGLALGFALLIVAIIAAEVAGRDVNAIDSPDYQNRAGLWAWPALLAGLAGWLVFVYTRKSGRARGVILAVAIAAGSVISAVGLIGALPRR